MNLQNRSVVETTASGTGLVPGHMSSVCDNFETEALLFGHNSPQHCTCRLHAEQVSGSPFTALRVTNQRSWLHGIRRAVSPWNEVHPVDGGLWRMPPAPALQPDPAPRNQ